MLNLGDGQNGTGDTGYGTGHTGYDAGDGTSFAGGIILLCRRRTHRE